MIYVSLFMPNELTLRVSPEVAATPELLRKEVERVLRGKGCFNPKKSEAFMCGGDPLTPGAGRR